MPDPYRRAEKHSRDQKRKQVPRLPKPRRETEGIYSPPFTCGSYD